MGFNTTVVVMNDAVGDIENDAAFGRNLSSAITSRLVDRGGKIDVPALSHGNAARVVEVHHADGLHLVLVGGNRGVDLGYIGSYNTDEKTLEGKEAILRALANNFGLKIAIRK